MKCAALLFLWGFAAVQLAEVQSYTYWVSRRYPTNYDSRYPTRYPTKYPTSYGGRYGSRHANYLSLFGKPRSDPSKYYNGLGQPTGQLLVSNVQENFCNRQQDCPEVNSDCDAANNFVQKVCSEGGLIYFIIRRWVMPALLTPSDCHVARQVRCRSWNTKVICLYLDRLVRARCPAGQSRLAEGVDLEEKEGSNEELNLPTTSAPPSRIVSPALFPKFKAATTAPPLFL